MAEYKAESARLTADEYMALLLERQAAYIAENPPVFGSSWAAKPLLEWFIQPGDEQIFTPPEEVPQPKGETKSRTYRSAASLRDERDQLAARRAPLEEPLSPDRAASGGQAIGARTMRLAQREDSRLRQYVALTRRIDALDYRIRRAEARERRALS